MKVLTQVLDGTMMMMMITEALSLVLNGTTRELSLVLKATSLSMVLIRVPNTTRCWGMEVGSVPKPR